MQRPCDAVLPLRARFDGSPAVPDGRGMPSGRVTFMPAFDDEELELPLAPSDPIAVARARHRTAGAILAAGMLGLDQAMGMRKPREEAPIVVDASDEPVDIDADGIVVPVDESTAVHAPPQPRSTPISTSRRRRRR